MKDLDTAGHSKNSLSSIYAEINVKIAEKEHVLHLNKYLDDNELREVIHEVGDSACMLLQYYIRLAGYREMREITDDDAALHFGWQRAKVQRHRIKLEKAGYFFHRKFKATDGTRAITYYIGKDAVAKA